MNSKNLAAGAKGLLLFLAASVALHSSLAGAVNATPGGLPTILGSALSVSKATFYEPYPIEPGSLFDLWVRVEHAGKSGDPAVSGAECALEQKFPFFAADPADDLTREVGTLYYGQNALLKFKLRADQNALNGENKLLFKCRSGGSDWTSTELPLFVRAAEAILSIEAVESLPGELQPGGNGSVKFSLKNLANAVVKDVQLKLDLSSASLPLAPLGSSSDATLPRIQPDSQATLSFGLIVSPSALPGVYKIPVQLAYRDELGNKYLKNSTVAVIVSSQPEVIFALERSDVLRNGAKASVVLAVTNKGISDVKSLQATVEQSPSFEVLSPSTSYLGDIASNDFETVEVELFVNTSAKEISIPMRATFRDALNRPHSISDGVRVRVYSPDEISALQLEQAAGGASPLLLGAAAVVLAYLGYRFFLKRRGRA